MSRKTSGADVVDVRTLVEQEWAYARRAEHLSYRQMRIAANLPVDEGGLGYDLSEHALKGLVGGYVERMRETLEHDAAEEMARNIAELDAAHRRLSAQTGPVDLERAALLAAHFGYGSDVAAFVRDNPTVDVWRSTAERVRAEAELRAVAESRRRLLGTDAPTSVKVDVVQHDAIVEELNAMLERAGHKPMEVPRE